MAGDWLKWTKGFARKPEVISIAATLGKSRHEAASILMELFEWVDEQSYDGVTLSVTRALPDTLSGVTGLADAMISAGWLREENGGIEFVNLDRHLTQTAKTRALSARRASTFRSRKRDGERYASVTPSVTSALPEKRRVKKKKGGSDINRDSEEEPGSNDAEPSAPILALAMDRRGRTGKEITMKSNVVLEFERWKGAEITPSEFSKVRAFVDDVGDYWLVVDAVKNAVDSKATYGTISKAIGYVRAIVEQCRREDRRPGENVSAKTVREKETSSRADATTETISRKSAEALEDQRLAEDEAKSEAELAREKIRAIGDDGTLAALGVEFVKAEAFKPMKEPTKPPTAYSLPLVYKFLDWYNGRPNDATKKKNPQPKEKKR